MVLQVKADGLGTLYQRSTFVITVENVLKGSKFINVRDYEKLI